MILTGFLCATVCALPAGQVSVIGEVAYVNGQQVGSYIDNEHPDQAARTSSSTGLRLVGVAQGRHGLPARDGSIRLRQFYPAGWASGWHLRKGDGYLLQGAFRWPGTRAATRRERRRMWCMAKARRPLMILWYGWTPRIGHQVTEFTRRSCR